MERSEVILQAGIEGGSITLYGTHNGKCWAFSTDIHDQTPELIDEPGYYYQSKPVFSWLEALDLLRKYQWHKFYPLAVHPVFRGAVLAAVLKYRQHENGFDTDGLRDWMEICGEIPAVECRLVL